jgi:hypothetical protein
VGGGKEREAERDGNIPHSRKGAWDVGTECAYTLNLYRTCHRSPSSLKGDMSNLFDRKDIKYIKWWEHVILWLIPACYAWDEGERYKVKTWQGKIYYFGKP